MKFFTITFGFLFFLFLGTSSYAQKQQIRAYTIEHGLPQSQVFDLVQDHHGYLWLATQGGGIAKFDGALFTVFSEKKRLLSNYVNTFFTQQDSLFIGTKQGLSIRTKNTFFNYKSPAIVKIKRFNKQLFLCTANGLYTFSAKKNTVSKIEINTIINAAIVKDIAFENQQYYIATNKGLWTADPNFKTLTKISDFDFTAITSTQNSIFCASYMNGILVIDKQQQTSKYIYSATKINALNQINGNLWIATFNSGIAVLNPNTLKVIKTITKRDGLPITHIRKALKDRQNNIWLASSGNGFFKLSENNFTHYNTKNGLKGNRIYAIHKYDNALYISTSEVGLSKIDSLGIHPIKNNYLDVKVKTMAHDTNGNLFVGTDGKGIVVMHRSKKDTVVFKPLENGHFIEKDTIIEQQFIDTLHVKKGFPFDWIRKIHVYNNTVWVASYSSGLFKFEYDSANKRIINSRSFGVEQGLKDVYCYDLTTDAMGKLWYVTKNGDIGFIANNHVTHFEKVLRKNTAIKTILSHNNQLFVGTSDNGIWWSNNTIPLNFKRLKGEKELYSNNIYQLIFDANDHLWAGSENGVDKITLDPSNTILDIKHYGRNEGFLGIETCLNSVAKDKANNLWFGTIYGLTKYTPNQNTNKAIKPKIYFENIKILNNNLDTINLLEWTNTSKSLALKPHQNLLTFQYKTVDLNNSKDVEYRWKRDDKTWSDWSKDNSIHLESSYGKHLFKAQSRNLNWLESDMISFRYFIKIPLLKKTWFRQLLIGLLTLLVVLFVYAYFRRLKKKNSKEKAQLQLQNKLLSLEQKALRLQMNPHFIFNVLNGIKAMSKSNPKQMNTTIHKFATLLRATLTNSRKDSISLEEELIALKNYIEVEQLMAEKPFTYKLEVKSDLASEEIMIPPMLIQPFVENAIKHGIMPLDKTGNLSVIFSTSEGFLHCEITDNGIGFNVSKQNKLPSNHQSMALEVTKERISHLTGKSALKIEEITTNGKVNGTKVSFYIPLQTAY